MVTHSDIGDLIASDLALLSAAWDPDQPTIDPANITNDPTLIEFIKRAGNRVYRPWIKDRLEFAFDDPPKFAAENRATDAIFLKLLEHLRSATGIDDNGLVTLVNKFAGACTRDVWKQTYQPILQRTPFTKVTTSEFNQWLVQIARTKPIRPQIPGSRVGQGFPDRDGQLYPISPDSDLVTIVVWRDSVDVFTTDFQTHLADETTMFGPAFAGLFNQPGIEYPMLIDAVMSSLHDNWVELVDVVPMAMYQQWPGKFRRSILENLYGTILADNHQFSLCDGFRLDQSTDIDAAIQHFNEAHPGATIAQGVFVADEMAYTNSTIMVPLLRG